MIDAALLWVIVGGFLEPVWVVGLKKYNDTRNLAWGAFAVESISVGVAYSIWTGIGAVMTVIAGIVLYKDRIDRLKVLFIFLIIIGVVGLEMSSEVAL